MTSIKTLVQACQKASLQIASLDSKTKRSLLLKMAENLLAEETALLQANSKDIQNAQSHGLSEAMLDRLILNKDRIGSMAQAIAEIAEQEDPVGKKTQSSLRPNGIEVCQMQIPLGVIAMIYESRPNVTTDAAALCLKSGNAVILRGGSEAFHSNQALAKVVQETLQMHQLSKHAVTLVPTTDRDAMVELLTFEEEIDLVIPRGGEGLIRFVSEHSRIPVIKHYKGVCHQYVDEFADLDIALKLLADGKVSRPGVCNAIETLLVHEKVARAFFESVLACKALSGVEIRACPRAKTYLGEAKLATENDFGAEFLDKILSVKVVSEMQEAIDHIHQYGSDHTEVIVTQDIACANSFVKAIHSSVIMVNTSSRFSDGGQLGLGAEIGISTTKLHAFGPMGAETLTTRKFVVLGQGQTRHAIV